MYKIDILRRAVKDIARLPSEYGRLVTQHIRDLAKNPRPHDAKSFMEATSTVCELVSIVLSTRLMMKQGLLRFFVCDTEEKHIGIKIGSSERAQ